MVLIHREWYGRGWEERSHCKLLQKDQSCQTFFFFPLRIGFYIFTAFITIFWAALLQVGADEKGSAQVLVLDLNISDISSPVISQPLVVSGDATCLLD